MRWVCVGPPVRAQLDVLLAETPRPTSHMAIEWAATLRLEMGSTPAVLQYAAERRKRLSRPAVVVDNTPPSSFIIRIPPLLRDASKPDTNGAEQDVSAKIRMERSCEPRDRRSETANGSADPEEVSSELVRPHPRPNHS